MALTSREMDEFWEDMARRRRRKEEVEAVVRRHAADMRTTRDFVQRVVRGFLGRTARREGE